MKCSKVLLFWFMILAGIIVGALIAMVTKDISWLSWLSYSKSIGISAANPLTIDLSIIRFTFGFEMGVSIAQIITIIASLLIYRKINI